MEFITSRTKQNMKKAYGLFIFEKNANIKNPADAPCKMTLTRVAYS